MKKFLTPALVLVAIAGFNPLTVAQEKDEGKRQAAPVRNVDQAEEAEMVKFAECVSGALKKSAQKRENLTREGKDPESERAVFSLWHGKKKTRKECPYPN